MFCGKCGSKVPDGVAFCPICGNALQNAPKKSALDFFKKPRNIGIIAAILLLIAAAVVLVVVLNNNNDADDEKEKKRATPESVVEDYIDAISNGDGEDVYKASNVEAFFDLLIDEGEWDRDDLEDVRDNIIDYYYDLCDDRRDYCEDEYGYDWSLDIEITKTKELKNSELKDYEEYIEDLYDIEIEIEEGYTVKYKVSIEGEYGDDVDKGELDVLKINGKWVLAYALGWGSWYAD